MSHHTGQKVSKQRSRQAVRQENRQTDILTDRQTDRLADGRTGRQTDRRIGGQADRQRCVATLQFIVLELILIRWRGKPSYSPLAKIRNKESKFVSTPVCEGFKG